MKKTLNNFSKNYKPILDTVDTFRQCPSHALAKAATTPTFCKRNIIWTNQIRDMNFFFFEPDQYRATGLI